MESELKTLKTMSDALADAARIQKDTKTASEFTQVSQGLTNAVDFIKSLEEQLRLAEVTKTAIAEAAKTAIAEATKNSAVATTRRRDFRIPSVTEADKFDGSSKTAPASKACKILTTYFNHVRHQVILHGFRNSSSETTDKDNHATACVFFSGQLQGSALTLFSALPTASQDMTTDEYFNWITTNFAPPFLKHDLTVELHNLKHKSGPLSALRVKFDNILLYLAALGNPVADSQAKTLWFNALSHQLRKERELFTSAQSEDSLAALQERCIILDNFNFAANKPETIPNNNNGNRNVNANNGNGNRFNGQTRNNNRFQNHGNPAPVTNAGQQRQQQHNYVPANVHVPMQVDNIQQQQRPQQQQQQQQFQPEQLNNVQQQQQPQPRFPKLTDAEKLTYKTNGWCTFCRAKNHVWANCNSPGKSQRR